MTATPDPSDGHNFPRLRAAVRDLHRPLAKLLCGEKAGTQTFALAPNQRADPKDLAAGGECETEQFRNRQRAARDQTLTIGDGWGFETPHKERFQSALGNRRMVNSIAPSGNSRQLSTPLM
jgi:hypothetical protein